MNWNIEHNEIRQSFADLKLHDLRKICINQSTDWVEFLCSHQTANNPAFQVGDRLRILKENTSWFYGTVTKTPSRIHAHAETNAYCVSGPWWFLENLIYQQTWQGFESKSNLKSRIILGQAASGELLKTGSQIREILTYAQAAGVPLQIGVIEPGNYIPFEECKDLTCAEAIIRMLRWMPSTVTWFDYTTLPYPTIHISSRNQLKTIYVGLNSCQKVLNLTINPRHDLQTTAVILKYERTHYDQGFIWSTLDIDKYPENAPENQIKAIVLTIELEGNYFNYITQKVTTLPVECEDARWWKEHLPQLNTVPLDSIGIKGVKRLHALPYELVTGAVAPWMQKKVAADRIEALISYETNWEKVVDKPIQLKLHVTDASSKTYKKLVSGSHQEAVPQGLAQSLYEATHPLQFEGTLKLINPNNELEHGLGSTLNITESLKEWEYMQAVIQKSIESIDTEMIELTFGPAKHLGADDFIEILRINRRRKSAPSAEVRSTGKFEGGSGLEQATYMRMEHAGAGGGKYQRLMFEAGEHPERRIILDVEKLQHSLTVEFNEDYVYSNGKLQKRLILASQPYLDSETTLPQALAPQDAMGSGVGDEDTDADVESGDLESW